MKKVICLGGGNNQLAVIKSALRLNLEIIVIDKNPLAKGIELSTYFINESTHDFEIIFKKINQTGIRKDIIGILNRSSGYPVITNSILSNLLNLEYYSKYIAECCISKYKVNKLLRKENILVPNSIFLNNKEQKKLFFPFILKPEITPGGKYGVSFIDSISNFNKYIKKHSDKDIIKEEFIDGRDVCLGAIILDKELLPIVLLEEVHKINECGEIFSKGIIAYPPELDCDLKSQIIIQAKLIAKKLDIKKSFVWISFKYTYKKELFFIEIHLDMGGDFVLDFLLPAATGKDNVMDDFLKIYLFGKKYYTGMLKLKLTLMEFDKGNQITNDNRKLLIKQNLNYKDIKKEFNK